MNDDLPAPEAPRITQMRDGAGAQLIERLNNRRVAAKKYSGVFRGNFGATSFILIFLLSVCAALAFTADRTSRAMITGAGSILGLAVASYGPVAFFIAIMIPSLVHVSLFTFIFIWIGYLQSGSRFQLLLACVYVSSVTLILLYPPAADQSGEMAKLAARYFGGLSEALGDVLGKENIPLDGRLAGLLSFVTPITISTGSSKCA